MFRVAIKWFIIYLIDFQFSSLLFSDNASRYCSSNGEWVERTDYEKCQHISSTNKTCDEFDFENSICTAYVTSFIYYVGYTISLIALILAVIVFINFK